MPVIVHEFLQKREAPQRDVPQIDTSEPVWKALCLHCGWSYEDIQTFNAVEAKAIAHSVLKGHDVEIRFSVIDCLSDVIRASDPRG